jgi:hypothetical protein
MEGETYERLRKRPSRRTPWWVWNQKGSNISGPDLEKPFEISSKKENFRLNMFSRNDPSSLQKVYRMHCFPS